MTDDGRPPAGWYPTPEGHRRYWDGKQWTEHTVPGADAVSSQGFGDAPAAEVPLTKSSNTARVLVPIGACVALAVIAVVIAALAGGGDEDEAARVATSTEGTTTTDDAVDTTDGSDDPTTTPSTTTTSTTIAPDDPLATADISGQWSFTLTEARCTAAGGCGDPITAMTVTIACPGPRCQVTVDEPASLRLSSSGPLGGSTADGPSSGIQRGFNSFGGVKGFWECDGAPVDSSFALVLRMVEANGGQATAVEGNLRLTSDLAASCRGSSSPGGLGLTAEVTYDLTGRR